MLTRIGSLENGSQKFTSWQGTLDDHYSSLYVFQHKSPQNICKHVNVLQVSPKMYSANHHWGWEPTRLHCTRSVACIVGVQIFHTYLSRQWLLGCIKWCQWSMLTFCNQQPINLITIYDFFWTRRCFNYRRRIISFPRWRCNRAQLKETICTNIISTFWNDRF